MTTTKTKPCGRLTAKQEAFCQNYIILRNATQSAIKAGYSPHLIGTNSNHLLENTSIKARLAELRAVLPIDPDIATTEERKRRLTEIYRANLVDFQGDDREPTLSRDIPHHQAASEYSVSTTYTKNGEAKVTKSIKLLNPISAIQEHNKMERVGAQDSIVNNFNEIKIVVVYAPPPEIIDGEVVRDAVTAGS